MSTIGKIASFSIDGVPIPVEDIRQITIDGPFGSVYAGGTLLPYSGVACKDIAKWNPLSFEDRQPVKRCRCCGRRDEGDAICPGCGAAL